MDPVRVTLIVQALLEEGGRAVRDDAVALHLSEPQTAVPGPTLGGLPGQDLNGPASTAVDLVVDHVLQALVVGRVEEDERLELAPRVAVVHHLPAAALVPAIVQGPRDIIDGDAGERRGVSLLADAGRDLRHQGLDQVPDGHSGRDSVRVDDEVRHDSFGSEWHIFLGVGDTHGTLLAVARGELVAHLRDAHRPHPHLDETGTVGARREGHAVNHAALAMAQTGRAVLPGEPLRHAAAVVRNRGRLADDHVIPTDARAGGGDAVVVQLVVGTVAKASGHLAVRALDRLLDDASLLLLLALVRPEEDRPEDAPVDARLVHHRRIFLVVPGVARDGDNGVDAGWQLAEVQVLHGPGRDEGLLRVAEHVSLRVHPHLVVGDVHSHGLFSHGTLVRVTRRLVVVWERDDGRAHAQDHRRVDLAVRVGGRVRVIRVVPGRLEVVDGHGDHRGLLLLDVDVLDGARLDQGLPALARVLALGQLHDVALGHAQLLVVDDEQRPAASTVVGRQPELLEPDVVDDAHLGVEVRLPPEGPERGDELGGVSVHADPRTIDENLGGGGDGRRQDLLERLGVPVLERLEHRPRRAPDADVGHQRQVLDQSTGLSFRCLCRANHAPLRVVQLARLGELSLSADGRVDAPQVAQRGRVRQPV